MPMQSNTKAPEIVDIEHIKELPDRKVNGYCLGKGDTEQDAINHYYAQFKVLPVKGYRWGSYLYFEMPNG